MTFAQYLRLVDIQAKMLLKADASRLKLGYLWWFLEPLVWVAVFFMVFNLIMESDRRGGQEFLLFLACGKFAYIWFSKTVIQASNSLVSNQSLIGKINVPKSLFPMAIIQESLYRQSAVYTLLVCVLLGFGNPVTLTWLWLLPVVLVYYLMIIACSFAGSMLVCVVRDFGKFIPLFMIFLLFTSGIFWDVRALGNPEKTELLLTINPLAFMLDAHRQVLMYNTPPDELHLLAIAAVSLLSILALGGVMRNKSQYFALKVLS